MEHTNQAEIKLILDELDRLLEDEFIVWNSALGIRDYATVGEVKKDGDSFFIWMDEPYEMVGPLDFHELCRLGELKFEACSILTKQKWQDNYIFLKQESYKKRQKSFQDFERFNNMRESVKQSKELEKQRESRELLSLPSSGKLTLSQIKNAYKKMVKTEHPDLGGNDERFIRVTEAKDALMKII